MRNLVLSGRGGEQFSAAKNHLSSPHHLFFQKKARQAKLICHISHLKNLALRNLTLLFQMIPYDSPE